MISAMIVIKRNPVRPMRKQVLTNFRKGPKSFARKLKSFGIAVPKIQAIAQKQLLIPLLIANLKSQIWVKK